jgi:hypothetical protein
LKYRNISSRINERKRVPAINILEGANEEIEIKIIDRIPVLRMKALK